MTEKLVTLEELMELLNLKKDTVINVKYNQWLHNHPLDKLEFNWTISVDKSPELIEKLGIYDDMYK